MELCATYSWYSVCVMCLLFSFFFQAEDGIRDHCVTGVQTCALPILRPVILLPASALTGLTPLQLDALLAHELAHVRRYDYLVNLVQSVIETLLFYHPAVWWRSEERRVGKECRSGCGAW